MSLDTESIQVEESKVQRIFAKHGLEIAEFSMHEDDYSYCNKLYFLITTTGEEYALRLTNPLPKWQKYKTTNEVTVMQMLSGKVPIPRILDYSLKKDELGFEYILMDKVPGVPLNTVWESYDPEQRKLIIDQSLSIISTLKEHRYSRLGNFDADGEISNFFDCESSACTTIGEYFTAIFNARLKDMERSGKTKTFPIVNELKKDLPKISQYRDERHFLLGHTDFQPKNIMVKDGSITGVLDWEWAGSHPYFIDTNLPGFGLTKVEQKYVEQYFSTRNIETKRTPEMELLDELDSAVSGLAYAHEWFSDPDELKKYHEGKQAILKKRLKELSSWK